MKRNLEKEMQNYNSDYDHAMIAGVTHVRFIREMVKMISTPGFLPPHTSGGKGCYPEAAQSLEILNIVEICAFAALNVVREVNGLEPLYDG